MNRRTLLLGSAMAPLFAGKSGSAETAWPNRGIRIVVPFAAGSFTDVAARLLATELSEQLGQSVIVENRGGAGSVIGTTVVVRSPSDGYTLLLTDNSLSMSPGLYPNLSYDPLHDLAQISPAAITPAILLVRPGLGPHSLPELIALAKQNPGAITFGSGGPGSSAHLAMELLLSTAEVTAQHIPFRGIATALTEVIGGRVDMAISSIASGIPQVRGGTLLGLAVSGKQRSALLSDVPTFAEAGLQEYDFEYWFPLSASAGTPQQIIDRLNHEVRRACDQPRLRQAFEQLGALPAATSADETTRRLAHDIKLWRGVIARANISLQ